MIIGLGNDICHIARIGKLLENFGDRFRRRIFTPYECDYAEARAHHRDMRYGQFFAAKEACAKALNSGIAEGVFWRHIETRHSDSGAPYLRFYGDTAEKLQTIAKTHAEKHNWQQYATEAHVTLSGDASIANAVVVLEILPTNFA